MNLFNVTFKHTRIATAQPLPVQGLITDILNCPQTSSIPHILRPSDKICRHVVQIKNNTPQSQSGRCNPVITSNRQHPNKVSSPLTLTFTSFSTNQNATKNNNIYIASRAMPGIVANIHINVLNMTDW